jgi:hypothetical protein
MRVHVCIHSIRKNSFTQNSTDLLPTYAQSPRLLWYHIYVSAKLAVHLRSTYACSYLLLEIKDEFNLPAEVSTYRSVFPN